jgi:hypothetical protein
MKPVHIAVLVLSGAVGGAVIMKVTQKPQPSPAPVMAQAPAPAPAPAVLPPATPTEPATVAAPEQAPVPAEMPVEHRPNPFKATKNVVKPAPKLAKVRPLPSHPAPVVVAKNDPPPVAAPPVPAEQPRETPAPISVPPARSEPEHVTLPPPPPEPPHMVTLNAGTLIPVRLIDGLSSERNMPGDAFQATLDKELIVDGFIIAERGARVEGRVVSSDRGGKVQGVAGLAVELTRIHTSDGQKVAIQTDSFEKHSEQSHRQDATKVGAGAAIGAVIGAIAGGGKGAAIGAGVGGGAGAGDVLLTRGKPAALPSETRISFRLRAPVTLTEHRG